MNRAFSYGFEQRVPETFHRPKDRSQVRRSGSKTNYNILAPRHSVLSYDSEHVFKRNSTGLKTGINYGSAAPKPTTTLSPPDPRSQILDCIVISVKRGERFLTFQKDSAAKLGPEAHPSCLERVPLREQKSLMPRWISELVRTAQLSPRRGGYRPPPLRTIGDVAESPKNS